MNNSDLIVKCLQKAGVTHGFGIPSGNVLPLIESMRLGGMEFVLTAHEGSASFAADVMGRMTGKPGFCIATLGPGATNLATGVGSAYLDRSPMIAITCNLNTPQLGRRIQMWIDHHALFAPITKASFAATHDNVAEIMQKALTIALTEPMGPVHIDLPEDVSLAPANDDVVRPIKIELTPEETNENNLNNTTTTNNSTATTIKRDSMEYVSPKYTNKYAREHSRVSRVITAASESTKPAASPRVKRAMEYARHRMMETNKATTSVGCSTSERVARILAAAKAKVHCNTIDVGGVVVPPAVASREEDEEKEEEYQDEPHDE